MAHWQSYGVLKVVSTSRLTVRTLLGTTLMSLAKKFESYRLSGTRLIRELLVFLLIPSGCSSVQASKPSCRRDLGLELLLSLVR